jgi:hypothetical protein
MKYDLTGMISQCMHDVGANTTFYSYKKGKKLCLFQAPVD